MNLTEDESALVLAHRTKQAQQEAEEAFQRKAIATTAAWVEWSEENSEGLTFSTFVNQFNYQERDGKEMFKAVERILNAALPST